MIYHAPNFALASIFGKAGSVGAGWKRSLSSQRKKGPVLTRPNGDSWSKVRQGESGEDRISAEKELK